MSYPLVRVDPVTHLDGQRLTQDGGHGPDNVLQRPLTRHQAGAHPLLEDEVDGAAHVDVHKVTIHLHKKYKMYIENKTKK